MDFSSARGRTRPCSGSHWWNPVLGRNHGIKVHSNTDQPGHAIWDPRSTQPGKLLLPLPVTSFPCRSHQLESVSCVSVNACAREYVGVCVHVCVPGVGAHTCTRRIRTSWVKRNSHFRAEASVQGRKSNCLHVGSEEQVSIQISHSHLHKM